VRMGKTGVPYMGPMGFPREWEYDQPWGGNGNKMHGNGVETKGQLSLGLADRTHGAHSQPASTTVRV